MGPASDRSGREEKNMPQPVINGNISGNYVPATSNAVSG